MSGGRKVLVRALGSTGALFIQAAQLLLIGVQVFPVKRRARVQVIGVFRTPFGLRVQRVITGFFLAVERLIFMIFQRIGFLHNTHFIPVTVNNISGIINKGYPELTMDRALCPALYRPSISLSAVPTGSCASSRK